MKTVIEMALDAGFEEIAFHKEGDSDFVCFTEEIEKFAELVRADERKKWEDQTAVEIHEAVLDEREACAKVCDELHWPWHMGDNSGPKECASAIRARGQS